MGRETLRRRLGPLVRPRRTAQPAARPVARDVAGRRRRVTFVAVYAYATGGVPRAVFSVAGELARRGHEVEVISVYRTHPEPYVDVHPDVRVSFLEDRVDPAGGVNRPRARRDPSRPPQERRLDRQPTELAETDAYPSFSALTDLRLRERLAALPPGIVVTTRPELAVAATRWAPPDVIVVDQEHLTYQARPDGVRDALIGVAGPGGQLDALVTLTDADRDRWSRRLGPTGTRVEVIPNAPAFTVGDPAPLTAPVVIAAGRLTEQKAFDRLVDAFAPVAAAHPDWELHIYGRGKHEEALRAQIGAAGLEGRVRLQGFTADLEQRIAEASVYAMSSRYEGFPMVLLEAMTKGVPPVSVDCPEGPRQLIDDGVNGLLVGRGDVVGLGRGILRLVEDEDLRRRLGAGALETARDYTLEHVVDRWERLLDELEARRTAG